MSPRTRRASTTLLSSAASDLFDLGALKTLGLALLIAYLIAMNVAALKQGIVDLAARDFESFYQSAAAAAGDRAPYEAFGTAAPNLNPPGVIWLLQPLARLPYRSALVLWYLASLTAAAVVLWRIHRETNAAVGWLLAWTFATSGGAFALQAGQLTFLLLPLVAGAWLADHRGRPMIAGALLGLACYVKIFLGLYVVYWLWRRAWWPALTAATVLGVLFLLTYTASPVLFTTWLATLRAATWYEATLNGSVLSLLKKLIAAAGSQWLAHALASTGILGLSWSAMRDASRDRQWAIVGVAALLISPLGWTYYLPLLAGPLALGLRGRGAWMALLAMTVPVFSLSHSAWGAAHRVLVGSSGLWIMLTLWTALLVDGHAAKQHEQSGG